MSKRGDGKDGSPCFKYNCNEKERGINEDDKYLLALSRKTYGLKQ